MLITRFSDEDRSRFQPHRLLAGRGPVFHDDDPVEDRKDLGPVIDVPLIGLVRPMKPDRRPFNFGKVDSAPGMIRAEASTILDDPTH